MSDSHSDSKQPHDVSDDLTTSSVDNASEEEARGSDSVTAEHSPRGHNYVEDQPTVISANKGKVDHPTSRSYSLAEMTVGRELVGQSLGHFQLDAFVGAGGMGAVFRGHDTQLNRRVAVKVLSGEHNTKEDTVRRFRNEATSAARLDHPNIARVYFVGEDKGWNYIVFEYIDGTNLRDDVERNGPLEIDLAVSYLVQIAEALEHATTREVVHRDIKPSNILVDSQHRAKLVDMGLARLHQVNSQDSDLTASGMTLGTFDYISPEQARDPRSADVRSDLYSLGCTFFYMLAGRPPFPEGTVLQKLLSHSGEEPPDPREFRPDIPDEVVHILSRMMAKNPNDRFQKPGELIAAALVVIDELGLNVPHVSASVYVPTTEQRSTVIERHLPWVMPAIILLAVVFVMDAIWAAKDDSLISDPDYSNAAGMQPLVPENIRPIRNGSIDSASSTDTSAVKPIADTQPKSPPSRTVAEDSPKMNLTKPTTVKPPVESPTVASNTVAETPMETKPATPAVAVPENVILVPDDATTLYEAITRAQADPKLDTIELRYNGQKDERVLIVENSDLTIQAAEGFSPTVSFRPVDIDPHDYMLLVRKASLTLKRVNVTMSIPAASMQTWALFGLENADQLSLEGCQVTVQRVDESMIPESTRLSTAVINVRDVHPEMAGLTAPGTTRFGLINIENSMVRGEASLIRSNGRQSLRILCENSLLALSGNLLRSTSKAMERAMSGFVQLNLKWCTIDTGGSLIQREGASYIPLSASMNNCIANWGARLPMIRQSSTTQSTEDISKDLDFTFKYNVYATNMLGRLMLLLDSSAATGPPVEVDFATWQRTWDDRFSQPSESVWVAHPTVAKLFSARTIDDYALLDDLKENPALRPDERNAGVDFTELPFATSPLSAAVKSDSASSN